MNKYLFKTLYRKKLYKYIILNLMGFINLKKIEDRADADLYQIKINNKNPFIWLMSLLNLLFSLLIYIIRNLSDIFTEWYFRNESKVILLNKIKENESTDTPRNS